MEEVDRCCLAKGEGELRSCKGVLQGKVLGKEKKKKAFRVEVGVCSWWGGLGSGGRC